jgi:restriction system protein
MNSVAAKEIIDALTGNKPREEIYESENDELDILKEDIAAKSHEFIKDKILELDWDEMQELVAGVLRGMGYKTNCFN